MQNQKEYIEQMQNYIDYLKQLSIDDPEAAKKEATESLIRMGYIDEKGNILPPYNGQKVNEDDFTMGPGEIDYGTPSSEIKRQKAHVSLIEASRVIAEETSQKPNTLSKKN
jgi:hypothetical protein